MGSSMEDGHPSPLLELSRAATSRVARSDGGADDPQGTRPRRRGRPREMPPEGVLERIRALAEREEGLFRVHHTHPSLYARARRAFGSWEGAVIASGIDYQHVISRAVARAARSRRRSSRRSLVTLP